MRKLILVFIALFVFYAVPAYADYYQAVDIKDLTAVVQQDGTVKLEWSVKSVSAPTDTHAYIGINRETESGQTETVGRVLCDPPPGNGQDYYRMSYTDSTAKSGSSGMKYTYTVFRGPYTASAEVDTKNIPGSGGGGGNGAGNNDVQFKIFTDKQWDMAMWWYGILTTVSGGFLVIVVVRSGYKYMVSAANPGIRASFIEDLQRCILAMVLLVMAPVFVKVLIGINDGFVALFASIVNKAVANVAVANPQQLGSAGMFEQVISAPFEVVLEVIKKVFGLVSLDQLVFNGEVELLSGFNNIDTGNALANVLLNLSLAGFELYFNAIYTIRRWVVTATLVSTPLIVWVWVLTAERQVLELWAAELFQTIFLQTAHALTFGVFLSILCGAVGQGVDAGWLSEGLRDLAVWFASFGGAVAVLILVYVGYRYMTARNEKDASIAREGLVKAVIGLVILGLALLIAGYLAGLFSGRWY